MKIVFMGTPEFALVIIESLHREFGVVAVVTQPDRPQGRGNLIIPSPVKKFALDNGIKIFQPLRTGEIAADLKEIQPDFIAVAAFGQILKKNILDIPSQACVNVHASLLPKYRGASPINRAIIDGEDITGVTTILMDEGMDTGDMLLKKEMRILPSDTAETLHDRLAAAGASLCVDTIRNFDSITPEKQDGGAATYTGKLTKEDGRIDWTLSPRRIQNLVRGCVPWPGAFSVLNGKTAKIWNTSSAEGASAEPPGTILGAGPDGILVSTGGGRILVSEIQLEGKKRQSASTFILGFPLKPGDSFTSS